MRQWIDIINEENLRELDVPSTRNSGEQRLIDAGYKVLGSGHAGTVFQKPNASYALKLFDASDIAYATFVKVAKNNPNPHFPVFKGNIIKVNDSYRAVRTEILQPSSGRNDEIELIDKYIIGMRDYGYSNQENLDYMAKHPDMKIAADILVKILKNNRNFMCDVHQPNVMMRGSVMVFTDPIAVFQ